jgi:hypothetical protein
LTWKTSLAAVAIAVPVAAQPWLQPAASAQAATTSAAPPAVTEFARQLTGYPGIELAGGGVDRDPMTPASIWSSVAHPRLPRWRRVAGASGRGSASVATNDKVTIKVLDRRGRAPANADVSYAILTALNGSDDYNLTVRNGTATGEVPAGRYSVLAYVVTPGGQKSLTAIYRPIVAVTGNIALTLDARPGRRISLTTDNPRARAVNEGAMALIYQNVGGRQQMVAAFPISGHPAYVTPARPAPGLVLRLQGRLTRNGARYGSPYIYNLGVTLTGGIPRDPSARVLTRDLVRVRTTYASAGRPACAGGHTYANWPGGLEFGLYAGIGALPATRTEYFTPGLTWGADSAMTTTDCSFKTLDVSSRSSRFVLGRGYTQSWFSAPDGPGGDANNRLPDGTFQLLIPLLSTADAESGFAPEGGLTGTTTVRSTAGQLIGTSAQPGVGSVTMPPHPGRYTAVVNASRQVPYSDLAIRQHDVWTFASRKPPGTASFSLVPFLEILYRTALNAHDQAQAGARQTITLLPVDGQAGEPGGIPQHLARLRRVTLRISYNDGATWQVVQVRSHGAAWIAIVTNPTRPGARFASLRVTAQDAGGRTADQTLIHAYAIRH